MPAGRTPFLLDRRKVLKAAGIASLFAAYSANFPRYSATAQATPVTESFDWIESVERGDIATDERGAFYTILTNFPLTAVSAHWDGDVGTWPVVEIRLSPDGETFSSVEMLLADGDIGRATIDNRIHTGLLASEGATALQYRVTDRNGTAVTVDGFGLSWLNTTDGPAVDELMVTGELGIEAPPLVTRDDWGADENFRFDDGTEIWPVQHAPISHVLIHHTRTIGEADPVQAVRAIYADHAFTRGWGDIGYNFIVDAEGRVYEGRAGGQGAIGAHAFQYQDGSAGVALLGDYGLEEMSDDARASLVGLLAWLTADLEPAGVADIGTLTAVPVICGHRDLEDTSCPGDQLYESLESLREVVNEIVVARRSSNQFSAGDEVVVTEEVNLRSAAGTDSDILDTLEASSTATVVSGPAIANGFDWYEVESGDLTGWLAAHYLALAIDAETLVPGDFTVGDAVFVDTDVLNLRSAPGSQSEIIAELDQGVTATIAGGPVAADGYIWWQIESGQGIGWVVQQYLALAD